MSSGDAEYAMWTSSCSASASTPSTHGAARVHEALPRRALAPARTSTTTSPPSSCNYEALVPIHRKIARARRPTPSRQQRLWHPRVLGGRRPQDPHEQGVHPTPDDDHFCRASPTSRSPSLARTCRLRDESRARRHCPPRTPSPPASPRSTIFFQESGIQAVQAGARLRPQELRLRGPPWETPASRSTLSPFTGQRITDPRLHKNVNRRLALYLQAIVSPLPAPRLQAPRSLVITIHPIVVIYYQSYR